MIEQRSQDRLDILQQAMGCCGECCDAAAGLSALDLCCAHRALPDPVAPLQKESRNEMRAVKERGR